MIQQRSTLITLLHKFIDVDDKFLENCSLMLLMRANNHHVRLIEVVRRNHTKTVNKLGKTYF